MSGRITNIRFVSLELFVSKVSTRTDPAMPGTSARGGGSIAIASLPLGRRKGRGWKRTHFLALRFGSAADDDDFRTPSCANKLTRRALHKLFFSARCTKERDDDFSSFWRGDFEAHVLRRGDEAEGGVGVEGVEKRSEAK
jgi:hypothetical protein